MPTAFRPLVVAMLGIAILLPDIAAAQRRGRDWPPQQRRTRAELALEASGLFTTVNGDALGSANDGAGLDVTGLIGSGPIALGIGWQRQSYNVSGGNDLTVDGFYLEPRVALPVAVGNFTPYLFGRVARLTRDAAPGLGFDDDDNGTALGGGLGTLMWLAPNMQLNVAALWQEQRFDAPTSLLAGSDRRTSGTWGARVGLTVGFDRWGR